MSRVSAAAVEDRGGPAPALTGEERALEPELGSAAEVQALGVPAAPRELEEPRARRARDAERVGQPRLVESVELAHGRGRAERPLRAGIVKAAHGLEADGRPRAARRDPEAQGQP